MRGLVRVNGCVLPPLVSARFGFYKYMKMDEEEDDRPFFFPNPDGKLTDQTHTLHTVQYTHTHSVSTVC